MGVRFGKPQFVPILQQCQPDRKACYNAKDSRGNIGREPSRPNPPLKLAVRDRLVFAILFLLAAPGIVSAQPTTEPIPLLDVPVEAADTLASAPPPSSPDTTTSSPYTLDFAFGVHHPLKGSHLFSSPLFTFNFGLGYSIGRVSLQSRLSLSGVRVHPSVVDTAPNADDIDGHTHIEGALLGEVTLFETNDWGASVMGGAATGGINTDHADCPDDNTTYTPHDTPWWQHTSESCDLPSPDTPLQVKSFYPQAGIALQKRVDSNVSVTLNITYSKSQFRWNDRPPTGSSIKVTLGFSTFPQ